MKKLNSFRDLFIHLLSDIYAFENLNVAELPKLIKKTDSDELKRCLQQHLAETKTQVKRLEHVFKLLDEKPFKVDWMQDVKGLIVSTEKFLKDDPASPLVDAAIIAITQRIEHYEIATYGTLAEFADCVGNDEIKKLLGESLKEEEKADVTLSKIAKGGWFKSGINAEATHNLQSAGAK